MHSAIDAIVGDVSDNDAASGPTSGYKLTYRGFSIVFTVRNLKRLIVITAAAV